MKKKTKEKRQYILDKSKEVFIRQGYSSTTMKDIVDACKISRGGLYLYFASTKEVFLSLFLRDAQDEQERMEIAIWGNLSAKEILLSYIENRKKEMLGRTPSLANATHEYMLKNNDEKIIRQWQFDGQAEMLRRLILYGIEKKEFTKIDASVWGRHITLFLNGVSLIAPILDLQEKRLDEQLDLLLKPLIL